MGRSSSSSSILTSKQYPTVQRRWQQPVSPHQGGGTKVSGGPRAGLRGRRAHRPASRGRFALACARAARAPATRGRKSARGRGVRNRRLPPTKKALSLVLFSSLSSPLPSDSPVSRQGSRAAPQPQPRLLPSGFLRVSPFRSRHSPRAQPARTSGAPVPHALFSLSVVCTM